MPPLYRTDWSVTGRKEPTLIFSGAVSDWKKLGPLAAGRFIRDLPISPETAGYLNGIHSETAESERFFLYNLAARLWSGDYSVVELGPFLGGTTRCLGAGMAANPLAKMPRLFTIDQFAGYSRSLRKDTQRLIDEFAPDDPEVLADIEQGGWQTLFERVHRNSEYGTFLFVRRLQLPRKPDDQTPTSLASLITEIGPIEILFIDGCKSWYGTKVFMQAAIENLAAGGYLSFQDYGRYTCFWITSFIHSFDPWFSLVAAVSGTYTFLYHGGLDKDEIARRFPDQPEEWQPEQFTRMYRRVMSAAVIAGDAVGAVRLALHWAAALATLGNLHEARAIIDSLAADPVNAILAEEIAAARKSPTWGPRGPVYL
jgi:hypothetical protein